MYRLFGIGIAVSVIMIALTLTVVPETKALEIDLEALQTSIGLLEHIDEGKMDTVVYKTVDGEKLSMDLYSPLESHYDKIPVVVFLHGGSWVAGSKETIANGDRKVLVRKLRQAGYAVAAVQYRTLSPTVNFPENIIDCQDSIRYIRSISEERGYDTNQIGYWGTSAGAHLAMLSVALETYANQGDPNLAMFSSHVDYIVDYYGPATLPALDEAQSIAEEDLIKSLFGTKGLENSIGQILSVAEVYSPLSHTCDLDIPMLIIHGSGDNVVPVEHSERLAEALYKEGYGNQITFFKVEGAGHGFLKESKSTAEDRAMIIEKTLGFIEKQR